MKKITLTLLFAGLSAVLMSCTKPAEGDIMNPQRPTVPEDFRIVPKPQFISYGKGSISLDPALVIGQDGGLEEELDILKEALESDHQMTPILQNKVTGATVALKLDPTMKVKAEGGYKINMTTDQITIVAPERIGIFYGIQTLRQAISSGQDGASIRMSSISDYPSHAWRSLMLDEGRYFQGKEAVKKILYEMGRLKYNKFHWHLTEDQGWRLEIKKYPNLIEIGSKRSKTAKNYYWISNDYYDIPHEGHYTQNDVKEIIAYAKKYHITIIPEIETVSHCAAAIASYPYLGTTNRQTEVEWRLGPSSEILDVSKPEAIQFVHDVLDEVIELFPSEYIHCGGDEIHGDHWKNSSSIRKMKEKLGITEDWELERYFYNELDKYLSSKGRKLMCWSDALGKHGEASNIPIKVRSESIIQYWTEDPQGNNTNLSNTQVLNFIVNNGLNCLYARSEDGMYFNTTLPIAYKADVLPGNIDLSQRKQIVGMGAECWTEFNTTVESTFDHIFPLIAVYSEVGWTKKELKDYQDFTRRLYPLYEIWKDRDIYVGGTEESR